MANIIAEITTPQLKKLHYLYRLLDISKEEKKEMLLHLTNGRTDSTAGLTKYEAKLAIETLAKFDPAEKHRKAIYSLAYKAGMIYEGEGIDKKLNAVKIDQFLLSRGTVKKALSQCTLAELKQIHRQFEGMIKNNKKTKDNKDAQQATDNLLKELSITIKSN